jgi:nitroimidazol reductase NimA-like FMN-containing flavoprotein (pyridoxamine 5'-phosphate oxidase superfamily)
MRVSKKEIKDPDVITGLLSQCHVGRLGTIGRDGYPMIKPLNFVYHAEKVYFHSAQEGEKMEHIRGDNRVCFEIDLPMAYVKSLSVPCKADYLYRSVIIKGRAHIVGDKSERLLALKYLMTKYQPEGGYGGFPEDKLQLTAIVRIDIEEITGKEDLGKDTERETVLGHLKRNYLPAVTLERK